jgi:hypothetical protein
MSLPLVLLAVLAGVVVAAGVTIRELLDHLREEPGTKPRRLTGRPHRATGTSRRSSSA